MSSGWYSDDRKAPFFFSRYGVSFLIIELWVIFFAVAVIAIWLGYYTDDGFHTFVGLFVIFYLCLMLSQNQVTISTSQNESKTLSYTNSTLTSEATVITKIYGTIDDTPTDILSRLVMFAAGFGMVMRLYLIRKESKRKAL
jgi:ABC-type multidrug transport system fused ATPase/permease subunit